jgi:replication fork protection complex subunit Csm3/Swi3
VLQVYQFWAHKLYPKTRFKETIDRVEKLCHSKRIQVCLALSPFHFGASRISNGLFFWQVALSVWRDEAKGLVNGARLPPEDDDNDSNADSDADGAPRGNAAGQDATSSNPLSPAARSRRRHSGEATSDSEGDGNDSRLSSDASHPPPSSPEWDEAAIELDALLEEEALLSSAHNASTSHAWKPSNDGDAVAMYEDEDLWDALDASAPASAPTTAPAPPATDDDEDMWDIVHELEQEREKEASRQTNTMQEPPAADDVQVDDLDDLYL